MKILVVGAGKVGVNLIENFIKDHHDVVIIDKNEKAVEELVNKYDVIGYVGSGCDRETLINAGIETADFFISSTSQDEVNILSCVIAKKLGASCTIARVRDPEYYKERSTVKNDLNIDHVFNPENITAKEIIERLKFPSAVNVESFADGKAKLVEFLISKKNPIIGKSLKDISVTFGMDVLIGLVNRNGKYSLPKGDFIIKEDDIIHVIGNEENINSFAKKLSIFKPKAKSVFIIGGGRIGYYLSSLLIQDGESVKILEKDRVRAETLGNLIKGVNITVGDATDQEVLNEEEINKYDACVVLTENDEENVIISLYAKQLSDSAKVITKVDRESVISMVKKIGLNSVASPKSIICNYIVKYVRSKMIESSDGIRKLYTLTNKVEAIEFHIKGNNEYLNVPIRDLKIKDTVLIGGIVRGVEFIVPTGNTVFLENDTVIVLSQAHKINEFLQVFK